MTRAPRIFLIDDDALSRQTLSDVLEAAGFVTTDSDTDVDLVVSTLADRHSGTPCLRLVKPVRVGALVAAIKGILARRAPPNPAIHIGKWRLDDSARVLEDDHGHRVRLTDKEAAILDYLCRADGVVARETLLAEIWGYSAAIATHTLETHIYRLRRKIEADPARAELLVTEPGGYRLKSHTKSH
jgi:DNA-binding response OmpR family regulator